MNVRTQALGVACLCVLAFSASAQQPSSPPSLTTNFINPKGEQVGKAILRQTPNGVLLDIEVSGVAPGEHAFHVHENGACEPATNFESAGGHYALAGEQHGYMPGAGPHAGDMPNQFVQADGVFRAHVLNHMVTLGNGEGTLFDANGSSIIIHAGADDYSSQPSGNAGGRIACAVIRRP